MVRSPTSDVPADQLVTRDGLAGALGEDRQDLLLAVGQLQRARRPSSVRARVELEGVGAEHDLLDLRRRLRAAAPQDVVDAQDQLARVERLRQIIVGAGLQAVDAAVRSPTAPSASGSAPACRAQALGEVDPVLARHHHVEDEQVEVEALPACGGPRRRGRRPLRENRSRSGYCVKQVADARVVVDHEQVRSVVARRCRTVGQLARFHACPLAGWPADCRSAPSVPG